MASARFGTPIVCASALLFTAGGFLLPALALPASLGDSITTAYTALGTSINWEVAGGSPPASSGTLGPFSRACAILEGKPVTHGDVVTRSVYVLDEGNGEPDSVVLHVYKKTDTFTTTGGVTSDVESMTPHKTIVLSLTSQAGAVCYMAANDTSVFAGTSVNNQASIIDKKTFVQTTIQSYVTATGDDVSQITAAADGIVFVTFGTGPNAGFAEFDGESNYLAAGQFFNFTVLAGTTNATTF